MENNKKQLPKDENDQLYNHSNNKDQQQEEDESSPFIGAQPEDAKGDEPLDEETDEADETDDTIGNP